jgi:hypothetical protein
MADAAKRPACATMIAASLTGVDSIVLPSAGQNRTLSSAFWNDT